MKQILHKKFKKISSSSREKLHTITQPAKLTNRWQGIHRASTSWIQKTKTNLNKVKPVKNIEKNLVSFQEMSPCMQVTESF